jgi:chromosomal replication initiator protein
MSAGVTIAQIIAVVAAMSGVTEAQIVGDQRQSAIVRARWMAMQLAAEEAGASLPMIGRAMASRDHSSVHYAVEAARALAASDEGYAQQVAIARALVRRLRDVGVLRLIRTMDAVEIARIVMAAPERQALACSTREIAAMAAWIVSMAGPDDHAPDAAPPNPLALPITPEFQPIKEAIHG